MYDFLKYLMTPRTRICALYLSQTVYKRPKGFASIFHYQICGARPWFLPNLYHDRSHSHLQKSVFHITLLKVLVRVVNTQLLEIVNANLWKSSMKIHLRCNCSCTFPLRRWYITLRHISFALSFCQYLFESGNSKISTLFILS